MPFCGVPPQGVIDKALAASGRFLRLRTVSRLYRSPAWPDPSDPPFINAVALVETDLSPAALLAAFHTVEAGFGRRRERKNAPRTLDIDLIDYEGVIRTADDGSGPILPHPRAARRDFVLAPLAEIAPDWRHPVSGESAAALLARLPSHEAIALETERGSCFAAQ